jgi:pimeloyl-ACP methyl ester carboxylesterase
MHFTHKWEKPVKAVLDFFGLSDVTIIGISLGGYLAPRAAAFDKRITKVVAWSVFPCFQDVIVGTQKPAMQKLFLLMMKLRARTLVNFVFGKKAEKEPLVDWGLKHGMYAYEAKDAYDYARKLKLYDLAPVADRIDQDMLILGAAEDHFIDYHLVDREIAMLKNTKSLTFRLFTAKEDAQNHCNVGNGKLALDTICNWIISVDKKTENYRGNIISPRRGVIEADTACYAFGSIVLHP